MEPYDMATVKALQSDIGKVNNINISGTAKAGMVPHLPPYGIALLTLTVYSLHSQNNFLYAEVLLLLHFLDYPFHAILQ